MPRTSRCRFTYTISALLVGLTLSACRDDPVRQCTDLLAAEQYETAAERCEQVFEETEDPRAGAAAARAHHALGNSDEVLAWPERLRGSD